MRLLFRVRTYVFCSSPSLGTDIRGTRAFTSGGAERIRTFVVQFWRLLCSRYTTSPREIRLCPTRGEEARDRREEPGSSGAWLRLSSSPSGDLLEDYQRRPEGVPNVSGLAFVAPWMVCSLATGLGHDTYRCAPRALNGDSPRSTDSAVSICNIGEDPTPRSDLRQAIIRTVCSRNEEDLRPEGRRSIFSPL